MRAIIQRVRSASVTVDGQVISQIGRGLCVLIGISRDDTDVDSDWICNKILKLCLFDHPDTGKRWAASVQTCNLELLCVSQFTLYSVLKGNKPDFHLAMEPNQSRTMYERLVEKLRTQYGQPNKVYDGQFGAMMQVNIVNDGPVTMNIESPPTLAPKVNKRDLSQQLLNNNTNNNNKVDKQTTTNTAKSPLPPSSNEQNNS